MEYFFKHSINSKKAKKKKKRKKQRRKIIWDNHNMTLLNLITSIIQLSVNGLNILINRC